MPRFYLKAPAPTAAERTWLLATRVGSLEDR
jgi:hypothetical protein